MRIREVISQGFPQKRLNEDKVQRRRKTNLLDWLKKCGCSSARWSHLRAGIVTEEGGPGTASIHGTLLYQVVSSSIMVTISGLAHWAAVCWPAPLAACKCNILISDTCSCYIEDIRHHFQHSQKENLKSKRTGSSKYSFTNSNFFYSQVYSIFFQDTLLSFDCARKVKLCQLLGSVNFTISIVCNNS